jgi:endonuclease/exonuclease/phosphatase (EEP) superfamily protein YafD
VGWVIAVLALLWALVRLFGLEAGFPLVALIAFTPYVALACILAAALLAVLRQWPAAAVTGVAAVLLVACIAPRVLPGPGPVGDPQGPGLRVMTLNLRGPHAEAHAVVELVRRERIDVLSLEEVVPSQTVRLRAAGLEQLLPGHIEAPPTQDTRASAIYSRVPFARVPTPLTGPLPIPEIRADIAGTEVAIAGVHPHVPNSSSAVRTWSAGMDAMPSADPNGQLRIVAGDFNATLDTSKLQDLIDTGYTDAADAKGDGLKPTFPASGFKSLPVTIDHVLVDERIRVDRYAVESVPGSDHRAVLAELTLP